MTQASRIRILADGTIEVVDPRPTDLDILRIADPAFAITSSSLAGFTEPRLRTTRLAGTGIPKSELVRIEHDRLWELHGCFTDALKRGSGLAEPAGADDASLFDVKMELAQRGLAACRLCARECGVNRLGGEVGACGLGPTLAVGEHYVHVAEEAPLNPSYVVSASGCGLRCRFCQQWPMLVPASVATASITDTFWPGVLESGARSLSFAGGNPDESLPGILRLLASAPEGFGLPVVWNSHAFSTLDALSILNGIVDVYLPDFKFGSSDCGRSIAGVLSYGEVASRTIAAMIAQAAHVIVRILVLPGHVDCCHVPSLKMLAQLANDRVMLSIRGQYSPDYRINSTELLGRRVNNDELVRVRHTARNLGLSLVDDIGAQHSRATVVACGCS